MRNMGNDKLKVIGAVYGGLAAACGAVAIILGKATINSLGTLSPNTIAVCAAFTTVVACAALFSAATARDCFTLARVR